MAAVDFGDISEAFETVSFSPQYEKEAYLCRETGRIYYCFSDLDDLSDELPEDIRDDRKYIQIPHKNELELGRKLVLRFVEQEVPGDIDYVYGIFRKAGLIRGSRIFWRGGGCLKNGTSMKQTQPKKRCGSGVSAIP